MCKDYILEAYKGLGHNSIDRILPASRLMLGLCDCERVSGNHGDLQLLLVVTLWFDLHVHLVRSWCLRP